MPASPGCSSPTASRRNRPSPAACASAAPRTAGHLAEAGGSTAPVAPSDPAAERHARWPSERHVARRHRRREGASERRGGCTALSRRSPRRPIPISSVPEISAGGCGGSENPSVEGVPDERGRETGDATAPLQRPRQAPRRGGTAAPITRSRTSPANAPQRSCVLGRCIARSRGLWGRRGAGSGAGVRCHSGRGLASGGLSGACGWFLSPGCVLISARPPPACRGPVRPSCTPPAS